VEDQHAQRPLAGAQGSRGEPAGPGQLLYERAVLLEHGEREVAGHGGVHGEVVLRGLRQLPVLARDRMAAPARSSEATRCLERRALETPLLRSTVRSLTSETSVRRSRSWLRSGTPVTAGRVDARGGKGARLSGGGVMAAADGPPGPARQPVGRHSSRRTDSAGVEGGERVPLGPAPGRDPSRAPPS